MAATDRGLVSSSFASPAQVRGRLAQRAVTTATSPPWLAQARTELDNYFGGTLETFTVPLDLSLTSEFDQLILSALTHLDYGTTTTYGRLTAELGLPREDVRKVGAALARNPLPVLIPCHRVVGADHSLTGYAGGLAAKRWLLDLESDQAQLALDVTG
ncbi:MAG TPA: methylated-DNA--[protein]-cysteine S-methyltransferase [Pseudonocardiaceae bacterium]|nr:methylated-DNA--[protein]-cysteine S-methyltransferase [Pseudonocardiaceae bacterium]